MVSRDAPEGGVSLPKRIKVVAVCFLLYGVIAALYGVSLAAVLWPDVSNDLPTSFIRRTLLPPSLLFLGAAAGTVGFGLLRQALWARPFAILISLFSLLAFPEGTLFGAFSLWALSSTSVQPEVPARGGPTAQID